MKKPDNLHSAIANRQSKTGTREWSQASVNCCTGCAHGCLYCYARAAALRFGRLADGREWVNETPRDRKPVSRSHGLTVPRSHGPTVPRSCDWWKSPIYNRRYPGVVMFPTTHDITPGNLDCCLTVLQRLLWAGNKVLVVSKPHLDCTRRILRGVDGTGLGGSVGRTRIEFRFTIGAIDRTLLDFWEPGAPTLPERMAALELVFKQGWKTSVSAEPLLEPATALDLIGMVHPFITETIWIGMANKLRARTAWIAQARGDNHFNVRRPIHDAAGHELPSPEALEAAIVGLEACQTPEAIRRVYDPLKSNPQVRWKDSYRQALGLPEQEEPDND
jgi:hypothetical protein